MVIKLSAYQPIQDATIVAYTDPSIPASLILYRITGGIQNNSEKWNGSELVIDGTTIAIDIIVPLIRIEYFIM